MRRPRGSAPNAARTRDSLTIATKGASAVSAWEKSRPRVTGTRNVWKYPGVTTLKMACGPQMPAGISAGGVDAWHRPHLGEQIPVKRRCAARLGEGPHREHRVQHQQPTRLEPHVDRRQPGETAGEETCARDERNRQGDFHDDEGVSRPCSPCADR